MFPPYITVIYLICNHLMLLLWLKGSVMIIHFTKEAKRLYSILDSRSFALHYCGEYFGDNTGKVVSNAAHPMVSFSSFEHESLREKTLTYGGYGIALNKTWATKNGLSPVNYIEKNSPVALGLIALLRSRQRGTLPDCLRLPVIQLKCFTKHVRGYNSYFKDRDFCFEDENEWRYVPTIKQIGGNRISVNFSAYDKKPSKYNKRLEPYPLRFRNEDIRFIYVQKEDECKTFALDFDIPQSKVVVSPWGISTRNKVI